MKSHFLFPGVPHLGRSLALLGFLCLLIQGFSSCQSAAEDSGQTAEETTDVAAPGMDYAASGSVELVEQTDGYGNLERYSRRVSDFAKEGPYSLFTPDGTLLETAEYRDDQLHGSRVLYYENGDTQVVERYAYGKFSGPYRAYYAGGALELAGEYTNDVMEGEWKGYYPNGQLREVVQFQDNEENGPFVEYHENGRLKAEGYYKDGDNEHGLLKLYDENGEHVKSMNCQHGVCRTVWEKGQTN